MSQPAKPVYDLDGDVARYVAWIEKGLLECSTSDCDYLLELHATDGQHAPHCRSRSLQKRARLYRMITAWYTNIEGLKTLGDTATEGIRAQLKDMMVGSPNQWCRGCSRDVIASKT